MRTYYRGPDALVTDEHFIWRTPSSQIFAVGELRNVGLIRGGVAPRRPAGALIALTLLVAASAAGWVTFGATVGYSLAALSLMITALALATLRQQAAHIWHLQATYRGLEARLYSSPDPRVFNQVARALRRSIEDSRPARGTSGPIAASGAPKVSARSQISFR
jgi:hypothetical protein